MPTTFKDYYATLGVPRTATDKEIRTAFRKLARKHHPDVNQGDKAAEDRFKEINEANEVLGDPEKRKKYDELGPRWQEYEQWERAGKPGPNPFSGGDHFGYRTVSPDELEGMFGNRAPFSDFFQQFFGGEQEAPTATRGRRRVVRRGQDVEGDAEISLEDAYKGSALTVDLSSADGPRRVEVKIPAGIHDGARVRATGQGSAGRGGGPRGDLFIRVHIRPHASFTRTGSDLSVRVPTPLATALAGGTVQVPTLRGTTAQLSIPAGTQNGARLRLRGLGMPHLHAEGAGDLLATVDVRLPHPVPEDLSAWAKAQHVPAG
ncbi:MAG TPA: J domain-containing protein [Candidatus Acidoferrales bacterium]|nr:J domain-containing protein [Candidatus Acidoferrales bacterium]